MLKGNLRIAANTAFRLSYYFSNSPKFWLGLQDDFDIKEESTLKGLLLKSIKPLNKKVASQRHKRLQVCFFLVDNGQGS